MTQISTSVQQTTEVVALLPAALTLQVAPRVPVYLDTPEMDLPVQVGGQADYVLIWCCRLCLKN